MPLKVGDPVRVVSEHQYRHLEGIVETVWTVIGSKEPPTVFQVRFGDDKPGTGTWFGGSELRKVTCEEA